ncbi:protein kinase C-binding protein NELL2-like isoform X2 [Sycon ciliatum]|uniref:protein kinase C-binding protein NELL2-like isoform X2 n=1 Tax=Sycon ciliatum TaxID=27933 RepID=UPI0031F6E198|eukprot:scpid9470/ scgid27667/ Protein kinase C-binding protein NELL2; NEL-like protein 2; Nel-related protein 2
MTMLLLLRIALLVTALATASNGLNVGVSDGMQRQWSFIPAPQGAPQSSVHRAFQFKAGTPRMCRYVNSREDMISAMRPACTQGGCFTVSTAVRVESRHPQTMLSITLPGSHFAIRFRRNTELRVRYTSNDTSDYWHRFLYQFRPDVWYNLAITICPTAQRVMMRVDCNLVYNETTPRPVVCSTNFVRGTVCVGGDSLANEGFMGSVQNLRINDDDLPEVCKSTTPATRELQCQAEKTVLSSRLGACQRDLWKCKWNGADKMHGESWDDRASCASCRCNKTLVLCQQMTCGTRPGCTGHRMRLAEADPAHGECCPYCTKMLAQHDPNGCRLNGQHYFNGSTIPRVIQNPCNPHCFCMRGRNHCPSVRNQCPPVPSSCQRVHTPANKCCPECLTYDKCAVERPCGDPHYSICYNLSSGRTFCLPQCIRGGVKIAGKCHKRPPGTA